MGAAASAPPQEPQRARCRLMPPGTRFLRPQSGQVVTAVLLGVGYRDCHTKREYIPLAQLHKFAQLMVALLTAAARM